MEELVIVSFYKNSQGSIVIRLTEDIVEKDLELMDNIIVPFDDLMAADNPDLQYMLSTLFLKGIRWGRANPRTKIWG